MAWSTRCWAASSNISPTTSANRWSRWWKEVLVRRGIFRTTLMRATGALALDADDQRELDAILDDLRPYFRAEGA